jgi:hypothetical protein
VFGLGEAFREAAGAEKQERHDDEEKDGIGE